MKNLYWKFLSLTFICAVLMFIGATDTFAHRTYDDGDGNGCVECHDGFVGGGASGLLHQAHVPAIASDCSLCHTSSGGGVKPVSVSLVPQTADGTGCAGCHGRLDDGGNGENPGLGAGLRQYHENGGVLCLPCHLDTIESYTPIGESVLPPFYSSLGVDPCADGLDNDGNILEDGNDIDCGGEEHPGDDVEIALEDYGLRIWDFSGPVIDTRGNNILIYTLIVDVKGKVTGSGTYQATVNEVEISMPVEIKGNVKGKNIIQPGKSENIVTLKYKVKGKDDFGNSVKDDVKLELEESFTSLVGSQKRKTCAKGQGCLKNTTDFSLPVAAGMTGAALISIDARAIDANDKRTKYEGTAELILSNGDEYPLNNTKGKYTNKKDETQYELKGVKEDNTQGIKTKLKLDGRKDGPATFIKGKALGQQLDFGCKPVETVDYVDVGQYLGLWYQIASYINPNIGDLAGVTAEYTLNQNGTVKVVNNGIIGGLDGTPVMIEGVARVVDEQTNAKLAVSFPDFGITEESEYWIIELAEDYSYAIVTNSKRTSLFILNRTPAMEESLYQDIIDRLAMQCFDPEKIIPTLQPEE